MDSGRGSLCLSLTYMKYFHHAALWRLGASACLKLPFYESGTVNFTADCACLSVCAANIREAQKQDQSCILAQNILLCGNLRLEFFRESLFRTSTHFLSSTAQVNAAQTVHSQRKNETRKRNLSREFVRAHKINVLRKDKRSKCPRSVPISRSHFATGWCL